MGGTLTAGLDPRVKIWKFEDREKWLDYHKQVITASGAAALCPDIRSYDSRHSLALKMLGLYTEEFKDEDILEAGLRMEPLIARWFADKTELPADDPGEYTMFQHPDYPFLAATLDRLTTNPETGEVIPLELKAPNAFTLAEWNAGVPLKFAIQLHVQMMCIGATCGYIAAVVGGQYFRYHFVKRNEALCDAIASSAESFMGALVRGEIPEPDGTEASTKALKAAHPKDNKERVALPLEAVEWFDEWDALDEEGTVIELAKATLKNRIKGLLGDNTFGFAPGVEFSWKHQGGKLTKFEVSLDEAEALRKSGVSYTEKRSPETRVLRKKRRE